MERNALPTNSNRNTFFKVFQSPDNARLLAQALHPSIAYTSPDSLCLVDFPFHDGQVIMLRDGICFMVVTETGCNITESILQLHAALNDFLYLSRWHPISDVPLDMKLEAYLILPEEPSLTSLPSSVPTDIGDVPLKTISLTDADGILSLYREAVQDADEKFAQGGSSSGLWKDTEQARERYIVDYIEVRYAKYLTEMILETD